MKFTVAVILAVAAVVVEAIPVPQLGPNTVFEACTTDSDCQQGCCAFSTGKCAGPDVAQTNGDGGCGFGNATPNCQVASALGLNGCVAGGSAAAGTLSNTQLLAAVQFVSTLDNLPIPAATLSSLQGGAAAAPPAAAPPPADDAASGVAATSGAALGSNFVTEACTSDSDCQQGCCAFATGKCAGPDVAQTNGDGGCGFGNATPNCQVAAALGLTGCVAGGSATAGTLSNSQLLTAVQFVSKLDNLPIPAATLSSLQGGAAAPAAAPPAAAPADNSASGAAATSSAALGSSFVTEACTSDSDCQQGCCAFATGKCAGPDVAQTNGDGGCGFGNATPNCQVAAALGLSGCVAGGSATAGTLSNSQLLTAVQFVSQLDNLPIPAATLSSLQG